MTHDDMHDSAPVGQRKPADETLASVPDEVLAVPEDALRRLDGDIAAAGGMGQPDPLREGATGFTMFDAPSSQDNAVTVLLSDAHIADAPSQSLVRIHSRDGRRYLGRVVAGPFAEPDGLRADSGLLVTVVTRGGIFVPPYHGRVHVDILGEEQEDGLEPPRYRPLPNSPAYVLDAAETTAVLGVAGDIRVGRVIGQEDVVVAIPSTRKDVLPRHTAILGTTGGGKSTTVARLVQQAAATGCAVIVLDVEGEYTFLHEPTADPRMRAALERRGIAPAGVPSMRLLHLVGHDTANPEHPARAAFSLQFSRPSPYTVAEIMDLTDPQRERFMQAYDVAKGLMRDLGIFPERGNAQQERMALELDDFDRGYPLLRLTFLMDVVSACRSAAEKGEPDGFEPWDSALKGEVGRLFDRVKRANVLGNAISWRALLGKLAGLNRLRVFDRADAQALRYKRLLRPGAVTVVDLSDSESPVLNNLVIADLLRGVQDEQDNAYVEYERARRAGSGATPPTRALVVVEEAHEFLSAERADSMPVLFEQVARIARRGRKRWLGLVFVTQMPQYLPRQLFGLVNGYVLHKIADPQVVAALRKTVSGIDDSLWNRLPGLAPGQAIVAFPHLTRPLLVAMDPATAQLRLVD